MIWEVTAQMAKRISSFSKEWTDKSGNSPSNKDVIKFLEDKGVAGKTASSNISDEEAVLIAPLLRQAGFSQGNVTESAPAPEKNFEEKKESNVSAAKETPVKNQKPLEQKQVKGSDNQAAPVKKKKIIIVGGNGNRNSYAPQGSRQPGFPSKPDNSIQRGPIKPRENLIDRAGMAAKRDVSEAQAEPETVKVQEETAPVKEPVKQEKTEPAATEVQAKAPVEEAKAAPQERKPQVSREQAPSGRERYNDNAAAQPRNFDKRDQRQGNGSYSQKPSYQGGASRGAYSNNRNQGSQNSFGSRPSYQGQGGRNNSYQGGQSRPYGQGGGRPFQGGRPGSAAPAAPLPAENNRRSRHADKEKDRDKRDRFDDEEKVRSRGNSAGHFIKPVAKKQEEHNDDIKVIKLPETVTIKAFAERMRVQPAEIVKKLFMQGEMVTVNQEISFEKAEEIALDYEIMCEKEEKVDVIAELLKEDEEDEKTLVSRPPVICVMGHVDHGKTSLLDAIRKTNVIEHEAGGITQKIGAYTVKVEDRIITFLDTPGHEAFTAMRMRGANSTDIAVLVVAADDGVMPQTVEAINHAKAAGIELIVAVNKIDKPGANIDRVKQELTEYELVSEDWGGSTVFVPVSAKSGEGIDKLLEMILLTADVMELKANPKRKARGLVIEAELDKGRGPVATVLVQKGTLKVGDFVSAGSSHGKVRAMIDDKGNRVREAGPSMPVEILGLNDVPGAGEIFICHQNEKEAKSFAATFIAQNKEKLIADTKTKMSLDDLFDKIKEGNLKELDLIVKADVQGSVEAVKQSLEKLSNEEIIVKVIHGGVGAINESDVVLASASNAIIIGFDVRPDAVAKQTAEREGVDIRLYNVIYQAIEDVESAMKGMLEPVYEEKVIGHAEVRQIFKASAIGNIAGAFVLDGKLVRDCKVRISREGEQIFEGALASLKRFKDDVKEVKEGFECGLVFDGFDGMQELDIVEAYIMVEVPRE